MVCGENDIRKGVAAVNKCSSREVSQPDGDIRTIFLGLAVLEIDLLNLGSGVSWLQKQRRL